MEYLMTYGWAILIIAVVLGALFQLGVFNASAFAPRAPPGACQVLRPNGPGTASLINLEGVCNGELPQYIVSLAGGSSSHLYLPLTVPSGSSLTISLWINPQNLMTPQGIIAAANSLTTGSGSAGYLYGTVVINSDGSGCDIQVGTGTTSGWQSYDTSNCPSSSTWYFLTAYVNQSAGTVGLYVNGVSSVSHTIAGTTNPSVYFNVSYDPYERQGMHGQFADVQIYNTSLSANEIQALYQEGIGGAPIKLQNLVGWWPLNGNANDYSGNNNNGVPSGVTYTSQWTSGYTPP